MLFGDRCQMFEDSIVVESEMMKACSCVFYCVHSNELC
jgi:hypothetical protein